MTTDDRVPVIWSYNIESLIGAAVISEDGTITITLTDPNMIDLIKQDKKKLVSISLQNVVAEPALPRNEKTPKTIKKQRRYV